jgi:hypothetical protein
MNQPAAAYKSRHSNADSGNFGIAIHRFDSQSTYTLQNPSAKSVPAFGYQTWHPIATDYLTVTRYQRHAQICSTYVDADRAV